MAPNDDILLSLINKAVDEQVANALFRLEERIQKISDSAGNNSNSFDSFTLIEVANFLNLPPATIYKYTSSRQIPHMKIGKHLLFDKAVIAEWARTHAVKTKSELEQEAFQNIIKPQNRKR